MARVTTPREATPNSADRTSTTCATKATSKRYAADERAGTHAASSLLLADGGTNM